MADPAPTSTSETPSQALSQFSFSLFVKLPVELQLEILSHCRTNDLICLSLSSHSLRDLTLPLIPCRPSLLSFDQAFPTGAIECSCGDKSMLGVSQDAMSHRRRRHLYMYDKKDGLGVNIRQWRRNCPSPGHECQYHSACRKYPADHPICHQRRCAHCYCTTCPLQVRLRGWMGDRKFCPRCRNFTLRSHRGRCDCLASLRTRACTLPLKWMK